MSIVMWNSLEKQKKSVLEIDLSQKLLTQKGQTRV